MARRRRALRKYSNGNSNSRSHLEAAWPSYSDKRSSAFESPGVSRRTLVLDDDLETSVQLIRRA